MKTHLPDPAHMKAACALINEVQRTVENREHIAATVMWLAILVLCVAAWIGLLSVIA